ncbi:hypothetical protein PV08_00608 [Exophiala spinifera]|uniref:Uncharacterized protein n=1 Tax=Exophiala spinifera TaxID=91928 RepID=A0A0D2BM97_9EURO|nr:uncharacterized protein PV08_00608 [Exophiala spinifera]KIW20033.1 hypothetical protein PV08_00608 [Exophiala spinifera]
MRRGPQDRAPVYVEPAAQPNTPTSQDELRSTIASLKASTLAAEQRTALLDAQSSLADKLHLFATTEGTQKKGHARHFTQREAAEVQYVKFANDDLSQNLSAELQYQVENIAKFVKPVHAIVSETFNSDDRALADLNGVDMDKPSITPQNVESVRVQTERLIAALRYFRQQALKDRLDRIYLESLDPLTNGDDLSDISDASPVEVQTDLGSLYTEIDNVVSMLVSQEYGTRFDSALKTIERLKSQADHTRTHDKLLSMTRYLEHTALRLEKIQEQRLALETLSAEYKKFSLESQISAQLSAQRPDESRRTVASPALLSLMQHLGVSDSGLNQLGEQIEKLESKYTNHAHTNVEQTLQISRDAPKSTQSALKDVAIALCSSTSQNQDIEALEQQISSARMELANITASAS